ncbi:MAG: membrane protein [Geminicoccaceae bacterium]|nr:MAG: membrane protein [Geminicoccaceae bacterium]
MGETSGVTAAAVGATPTLPAEIAAALPEEARTVLEFWLSADNEPRWFRADPDFDRLVAEKFGALVPRAAGGAFDGWLDDPWSTLALLLLVDQFPRNVHRGTPLAFAFDAEAREVARAALARGHHLAVPERVRLFFYLPFEHSEDPADQDRAVELCRQLGGEALRWAEAHRAVIRRFGRFPHRNAILGRPSTAAETAFLAEPGSSF